MFETGTGNSAQRWLRIPYKAGKSGYADPLAKRLDLTIGSIGLERDVVDRHLDIFGPFGRQHAVPSNPSHGGWFGLRPCFDQVAGGIKAAENFRAFQAVQVLRELVAIVNDPDGDIRFPDYSDFTEEVFRDERTDSGTGIKYTLIDLER